MARLSTAASAATVATAKSCFLKDVADHAQSLVRSLKRRPCLFPSPRDDSLGGVGGGGGVGSGVGSGKEAPEFRHLYDAEDDTAAGSGGKWKRIKIEDIGLKVGRREFLAYKIS